MDDEEHDRLVLCVLDGGQVKGAGNTASPDVAALLKAVSVPPRCTCPDWPEVVTPHVLRHFCASQLPGRHDGHTSAVTRRGLLCKPFAQLLRETPIPATGESTYCETHPRVRLTYGGCHVCRRGDDKRYSR